MDNIFTCLLLLPNKPINKLPINIPDAQIDCVIPAVFILVNERSIGIKSDCSNPTKNKTIIMIQTSTSWRKCTCHSNGLTGVNSCMISGTET